VLDLIEELAPRWVVPGHGRPSTTWPARWRARAPASTALCATRPPPPPRGPRAGEVPPDGMTDWGEALVKGLVASGALALHEDLILDR
jgi:hypothetical protein